MHRNLRYNKFFMSLNKFCVPKANIIQFFFCSTKEETVLQVIFIVVTHKTKRSTYIILCGVSLNAK